MKIFNPNTSFYNNYYDKAKFLLAWRISLAFTCVFTIISCLYVLSDFKAAFTSAMVLVVGLSCLIYLYFTKNYKPLFWVYSLSGSLLANISMLVVLNFTHYVDFMWILVCIFLAFVGINKKAGYTIITLNSILIVIFFISTLNKHIEILEPRNNIEKISELIEIIFVFFTFSYLIYQFIDFQVYSQTELRKTLSELEKTNAVLSTKNKENTLLLKEVHHRVKNNLQIIISLLRLQKNNLTPEAEKKFDEAINRIMTMSIIHKKLYQSESLSTINIKSYITDLVDNISHYNSIQNIKTNISSNYNQAGINTIVPLGLMLNELLTNSLKHAFNEVPNAEVNISTEPKNDNYFILKYSDNGKWKNSEENNNNFGIELIETLTEQLEGSIVREKSTYTFTLKNLDI
jgi:two-component sensor histidine kinase